MNSDCISYSPQIGHQLNGAPLDEEMKNKITREQRLAGIFSGVVITSLICTVPDMAVKVQAIIYALGDKLANYKPSPHDKMLFKVKDIFAVLNGAIKIIIMPALAKPSWKSSKSSSERPSTVGRSQHPTYDTKPGKNNSKSKVRSSYIASNTETCV